MHICGTRGRWVLTYCLLMACVHNQQYTCINTIVCSHNIIYFICIERIFSLIYVYSCAVSLSNCACCVLSLSLYYILYHFSLFSNKLQVRPVRLTTTRPPLVDIPLGQILMVWHGKGYTKVKYWVNNTVKNVCFKIPPAKLRPGM